MKQKGMNMEQKLTIPEPDTSPLVHPRRCRAVRNSDARTPEKKQKHIYSSYIQDMSILVHSRNCRAVHNSKARAPAVIKQQTNAIKNNTKQ